MSELEELLELMAKLRDPKHGCPWDRQQTYATLISHTLEEAYEVADAIARKEWLELREELGDLLFQIVFYTQIAREENLFDFRDVVRDILDKMKRRHPHVFGGTRYVSIAEQKEDWEQIKTKEKAGKNAQQGILDGIPRALPALTRAVKLQKKAAQAGFDWDTTEPVFAKIAEELAEIQHEIVQNAPPERLADELGDVLFAIANLARHLNLDPEAALRGTNAKFERRFRQVECWLAEEGQRTLAEASLEEMEALWDRAKRLEATGCTIPMPPASNHKTLNFRRQS